MEPDRHPDPGTPAGAAGAAGGGGGVPDLVTAVAQLKAAAGLAMGASIVGLPGGQARHLMVGLAQASRMVEASYLHVLSQFDRTPGVAPGSGRHPAAGFLMQRLNYSKGAAFADVAAARQLDPDGSGFDPALLAETDPDQPDQPAPDSSRTRTEPDTTSEAELGNGPGAEPGTASGTEPDTGSGAEAGTASGVGSEGESGGGSGADAWAGTWSSVRDQRARDEAGPGAGARAGAGAGTGEGEATSDEATASDGVTAAGGVADPDDPYGVHAVAADIRGDGSPTTTAAADGSTGTTTGATGTTASTTGATGTSGMSGTTDATGAGGSPGACGTTGAFGAAARAGGADWAAGPVSPVGLPRLGAAFAAGLIAREHVRVALRCLAHIPTHLLNRVDEHGVSGRVKVDVFVTRMCRRYSPTTVEHLAKQLLAALDPDGQDRFDPLAYQRRHLSLVTDSTGMTSLRGLLDPVSAAILRAALAHFGSLTTLHPDHPGHDSGHSGHSDGHDGDGKGGGVQEEIPVRDARSPGMRRVDALTAACAAALRAHYPTLADGGPGTQPAAPLTRIVITATPEQVATARHTTPPVWDQDGRPLCPPGWADPWTPPRPDSHTHRGGHPPGHPPGGPPDRSAGGTAGHPPGGSTGHPPRGAAGPPERPEAPPAATDDHPGDDHPGDEQQEGEQQEGDHRADLSRPPATPPATAEPSGVGLAWEAESGRPITPSTLGRLVCDADLQSITLGPDRAVLELGRTRRLATPSQRTALVARDRGCIIPGCGMPPSACDAHHVIWWRHGGGTDITNLALVCGGHHTAIHNGEWTLQMRAGIPYVVAPSWIDPTRTPRRNTLHTDEHHARHLGHTLGTQQQLPLDD